MPQRKSEKHSLTSRKSQQPKSNQPKRLGEEFEFDVAVKSAEPDFFVDMVPDLAQKSTVLVDKKFTGVNAKFEATDDQVMKLILFILLVVGRCSEIVVHHCRRICRSKCRRHLLNFTLDRGLSKD